MQESECRSVWSYAVDKKGSSEEWAIQQICEDLETVGLKQDRIIIKDDQEPAIIDVAKERAANRDGRFGTALDNSRVGDSDSNGTIERPIQDVEGQCRTMRSALEEKIGNKITLRSAIPLCLPPPLPLHLPFPSLSVSPGGWCSRPRGATPRVCPPH